MADFEPPSFSLGLDFDLIDSEPQITSVNRNRDDDFETLIVDDSEPEYPDPDPDPKLKRLFSSHKEMCTDEQLLTSQPGKRKQNVSNAREPISTNCNNLVSPKLTVNPLRQFLLIDSDSDSGNNRNCNRSDSYSNQGQFGLPQNVGLSKNKVTELTDLLTMKHNISVNLDNSYPPAHRYFFHEDLRIQELVRNRFPNFSPLSDVSTSDLEQPSTAKINYMGQFSCGESSSSKKNSRKLKSEDTSEGWVNPKLGVDKVKAKRDMKRTGQNARQTAGHWLTGSDGKKVYVGRSGQELTGRIAYRQYKKESGSGFKKSKRKSFCKKKKKK